MPSLSKCAFLHDDLIHLTPRALIIVRSGVLCGLKYQHWPMKQKLFHDQNGCQWRTVPHVYRRNVMLKNWSYKYRCLQLQEGPQTCLLYCLGNL